MGWSNSCLESVQIFTSKFFVQHPNICKFHVYYKSLALSMFRIRVNKMSEKATGFKRCLHQLAF